MSNAESTTFNAAPGSQGEGGLSNDEVPNRDASPFVIRHSFDIRHSGPRLVQALLRSSTGKPEHILHIVEARRLLDHPARGVECAVGEGFPTARLMN
jgi:hypothetical protein